MPTQVDAVFSLTMRGRVLSVQPTKGGEWVRCFIATGRAFNAVLMARANVAPVEGAEVAVEVRAAVDDRSRQVVFWLADAA